MNVTASLMKRFKWGVWMWGLFKPSTVSRRFSVGVAGRFQLLLLGESPWMLLGAFARAEYVWGF